MEWHFRDISDDPSEKELTQQDQFNNDEVVLAEALVRETIQNSTDARVSKDAPARVRFALTTAHSPSSVAFLSDLASALQPHLTACKIPTPGTGPHRILVIEDFETTGLAGAVDYKDDGQFCGFWRRFGRSNKTTKTGSYGGRWGLGKLVFSSSSSIRTLIGLTRRANDPASYLMGQAILRNHTIDGVERDSVGFWCESGAKIKKGLPTTDGELCRRFSKAAQLTRTTETGLSLVIPYVLPEIEQHHLVTAVLKNYYFPIMTGRLSVVVNDISITADTFDQVSSEHGSDAIPASVLSFVRQLQSVRSKNPILTLPAAWQRAPITGELLGEDIASMLRERFKAGEMLFIRAPLLVTATSDPHPAPTHIDLFLRPTQPGERTQTLVVRGSITVPTEGKRANLSDCHAALVADDVVISQLLGDAENPAHTQWNERNEKLKANWIAPHTALRRVRAVLHELHAVIVDRIERDDPLALVDFFSIAKERPKEPATRGSTGRLSELPSARPKPFRIERRKGGFRLLPNPDLPPESFPLKIRLRCAYDILNGNPFRRFSDDDFSFFKAHLQILKHNADCWPTDPNKIDIEARASDFRIEIVGFDINRDLVVEAQG